MVLQTLTHGEPQWDVKVNSAIKRINELGDNPIHWTEWSYEGVVIENGFTTSDSEATRFSYRKLVDTNGKCLLTQIYGGLTKTNYKGERTEFAKIGNVGVPSRQTPLGQAGIANNSGYVKVEMTYNDGTLSLSVLGNPTNAETINGWIFFNFVY